MNKPERVAESRLVYWCAADSWWVPLEDGPECPSMDAHIGQGGRMRKRRWLICSVCGECFTVDAFGREEFEGHVCNIG